MPYEQDAVAAKGLENADLEPAGGFWVAIIVTCYQSYDLFDDTDENRSSADADPDARYHIHGQSWALGDTNLTVAVTPIAAENVTLLFAETNLDFLGQVSSGRWPGVIPRDPAFKAPRTIGH